MDIFFLFLLCLGTALAAPESIVSTEASSGLCSVAKKWKTDEHVFVCGVGHDVAVVAGSDMKDFVSQQALSLSPHIHKWTEMKADDVTSALRNRNQILFRGMNYGASSHGHISGHQTGHYGGMGGMGGGMHSSVGVGGGMHTGVGVGVGGGLSGGMGVGMGGSMGGGVSGGMGGAMGGGMGGGLGGGMGAGMGGGMGVGIGVGGGFGGGYGR